MKIERATKVQVDDLQILATAAAGGMHTLLTANERDFPRKTAVAVVALSELEWDG